MTREGCARQPWRIVEIQSCVLPYALVLLCVTIAAAFQLGLKLEILHKLIFDYLESHQFDVSYFTNVCNV